MRPLTRLLLAGLLLALVLAGADLLFWRIAERRLGDGFAAWAAGLRADGWTIETGPRVDGGWPLRADLVLADVRIAGGPAGVQWSAERVTLSLSLAHARSLAIAASGRQALRLGAGPALPYEAASLRAVVPLDAAQPSLDLQGRDLVLGGPAAGLRVATLTVQGAQDPAAAPDGPAATFAAEAAGIDLPPGLDAARALGTRIPALSAAGSLSGRVPPGTDPARRAAQWRDGGGALDLRHVAFGWGPLGVSGTLTLALDDALQPMGTGTVRLLGATQATEALARAHVLAPSAATALRAVLGLLARPGADGAEPEVDLPLVLQDRTLSAGPVPVLRLAPLAW